jgi:hypothetical protein
MVVHATKELVNRGFDGSCAKAGTQNVELIATIVRRRIMARTFGDFSLLCMQ